MVKTTVYLEPDTAATYRQLAQLTGRSQAELIREALLEYARSRRPPLPKGIGQYHSGRADVSERAETILAEAARQRRWR